MASGHTPHDGHATPTERLRRLLWAERDDLTLLLVYAVVTGLIALAVPLAVQSLVNTIAQGFFLQPIVVLSGLVFGFLLFAGFLRLLQLALVETIQQRVFARVALDLGGSLPRIRNSALATEYGPELVNRFFDVLTIQKALSKLLLDGLAYTLTAFGGLALMAFYSPYLLGFDLALVAASLFVLFGLGFGGLRTSIRESAQKYRVAGWLEELARCHTSFKVNGVAGYLLRRTDDLVVRYIAERRAHFRVLWRQAFGSYLFQAAASAGVLAIGGWLVVNRELTLGQLVAAQLIVVSVLGALDKLVGQAEQVFDLLTGLDKVGHVTDLPLERRGGRPFPDAPGGASVRCGGVRFAYQPGSEVLRGLDLEVRPGERIGLVGASGSGKSTLANLLCGLEEPSHGLVEVNGQDVRDTDLDSLRARVSYVGDADEIFEGTIEDNVAVGRSVSQEDIRWALSVAGMDRELKKLPLGAKTALVSGGQNLSRGQRQRILIARAVVERPSLLILDEVFIAIDERTRLEIMDGIFDPKRPWTVIAISHIDEAVMRSELVYVLKDGVIVERGRPEELACRADCEFARLFPFLSEQFVSGKRALPAS